MKLNGGWSMKFNIVQKTEKESTYWHANNIMTLVSKIKPNQSY